METLIFFFLDDLVNLDLDLAHTKNPLIEDHPVGWTLSTAVQQIIFRVKIEFCQKGNQKSLDCKPLSRTLGWKLHVVSLQMLL